MSRAKQDSLTEQLRSSVEKLGSCQSQMEALRSCLRQGSEGAALPWPQIDDVAEKMKWLLHDLQGLATRAELEEIARKPAPAQGSKTAGTCGLRGTSASFSIPDLLGLLCLHHKTGNLRITTEAETFNLEILKGDVVHATSDSTDDQLLCSILVARDKISTSQLEEFYKSFTVAPGEEVGEALERAKLVSREDLQSALEVQAQQLFHRLFAAENAAFRFHEGSANGLEQRIRLNVTQLLLENARTRDESLKQEIRSS